MATSAGSCPASPGNGPTSQTPFAARSGRRRSCKYPVSGRNAVGNALRGVPVRRMLRRAFPADNWGRTFMSPLLGLVTSLYLLGSSVGLNAADHKQPILLRTPDGGIQPQ